MNARRFICACFSVLLSLFAAAEYTVSFYADGGLIKNLTTVNGYLSSRLIPAVDVEADTVCFLGWTASPLPVDLRSEMDVDYFDLTQRITEDIVLNAVYAVLDEPRQAGFSLLDDESMLRVGSLYVFADFSSPQAENRHIMSVNHEGQYGLRATTCEFTADGLLLPVSDAFVARLADKVDVINGYRFVLHSEPKFFALNSDNRTFYQLGVAYPLPDRWTVEAGRFSTFTAVVDAEARVRLSIDEKPDYHFAYGELTKAGLTYRVFHNNNTLVNPLSERPLFLYCQPRTVRRITLSPYATPLASGLRVAELENLMVRDGGLLLSLDNASSVLLCDAQGRVLISDRLPAGTHKIALPQTSGVFLLRINGASRKIIL